MNRMQATPAQLFRLDGKVALVTGARRGLGQALAVALAAAGAKIVGLGPRDMADTRDLVVANGSAFAPVRHDMATATDFSSIADEASAAFGPVDILVNNAGIIRRHDLLHHPEGDWDEVINVNLRSVFLLSQAIALRMVETGRPGRIVNIASLLSFQGGIRVAAYTAAKHGIAGLTRAMANELAPQGITVNAIAPGYMATDNTDALRSDPARSDQILARIPAGRWGEASDLATAILFLAAPGSGYVTGTILPVDGGWLAR